MKKDYIIIGVATLAIIGGIIGFIVTTKDSSEKPETKTKYAAIQPCSLFTPEEAKEILGPNASRGQNTKPEGNADLRLATCSYGVSDATVAGGVRIASVTIRSAVSDNGTKANQKGFTDNKSEAMETIEGYGDQAYYDQYKGQFNIHKGRNWIIVTNGGTDPSADTVDGAKLVADKVLNQE